MIQSNGKLPAFNWDEWYAAAGGRTIDIPKADILIKEIKEEQSKRFDGPVAEVRHWFESKEAASQLIKDKARELGADEVGVALIEPSDIYRNRELEGKFAIVVGQKMLWREFQVVPSIDSAMECLRIYYTLGETVIALAEFVRSLGYECRVEHPLGDSDVLHIPLALKAGFGELGRHGSIIHPTMGPLFRLGSVITSLDLALDRPIDVGIAKFCDNCKACRIYCPAKAIPDERSPSAGKDHLGNDRYVVDTGKCFPYFAKHNYCSICIPVCVYQHKEWAKDYEGFKTKLFPEIKMETPPEPVDPDWDAHYFEKVKR